jgi:hypothetical protein
MVLLSSLFEFSPLAPINILFMLLAPSIHLFRLFFRFSNFRYIAPVIIVKCIIALIFQLLRP